MLTNLLFNVALEIRRSMRGMMRLLFISRPRLQANLSAQANRPFCPVRTSEHILRLCRWWAAHLAWLRAYICLSLTERTALVLRLLGIFQSGPCSPVLGQWFGTVYKMKSSFLHCALISTRISQQYSPSFTPFHHRTNNTNPTQLRSRGPYLQSSVHIHPYHPALVS